MSELDLLNSAMESEKLKISQTNKESDLAKELSSLESSKERASAGWAETGEKWKSFGRGLFYGLPKMAIGLKQADINLRSTLLSLIHI